MKRTLFATVALAIISCGPATAKEVSTSNAVVNAIAFSSSCKAHLGATMVAPGTKIKKLVVKKDGETWVVKAPSSGFKSVKFFHGDGKQSCKNL